MRGQNVNITRTGDEELMPELNKPVWLTTLAEEIVDSSKTDIDIDMAKRQVMRETRIHACTALLAGIQLRDYDFDLVVVDEAATSTEPDLAGVMSLRAARRVLVCDTKQLGPVVKAPGADYTSEYSRPMPERLAQLGHPVVRLE